MRDTAPAEPPTEPNAHGAGLLDRRASLSSNLASVAAALQELSASIPLRTFSAPASVLLGGMRDLAAAALRGRPGPRQGVAPLRRRRRFLAVVLLLARRDGRPVPVVPPAVLLPGWSPRWTGGMPSSSSSSSLPRLRLPSNDASSCSAERASCSAALVRCTSPSSDKFTATERLTENFRPPERRRRRSRRTESPLSSEANNTRRLHRSRPMPMRAVSGDQWISASGRSKDVLMLT